MRGGGWHEGVVNQPMTSYSTPGVPLTDFALVGYGQLFIRRAGPFSFLFFFFGEDPGPPVRVTAPSLQGATDLFCVDYGPIHSIAFGHPGPENHRGS